MPTASLNHLHIVNKIAHWAQSTPTADAVSDRGADGRWTTLTWADYWAQVRAVAKGLIALGLKPGECVALSGHNCSAWTAAQFGITAAGGIPAPIYVTCTDDQFAYIIGHCGAEIGICADQDQLDKMLAARDADGVALQTIVTLFDLGSGAEGVITLDALIEGGAATPDAELDARIGDLNMDDTCLLIYTSGTTGVPKAVQITGTNINTEAAAARAAFPMIFEPGAFRAVSYLPLSHVAEQALTNFFQTETGGRIYFCGALDQIVEHLNDAKPTVFLGVPRVWEKFAAALEAKLNAATGVKAALASWARKTELKSFLDGRDAFGRGLANKLVIGKVQAALGLDQLQLALTGAAPISLDTLKFFAALGIQINEVWGMSETTGAATITDLERPKLGTVGKPLPGFEIEIADDSEILVRGPGCTPGYLHNPEATAELIGNDGWLHTGDLGKFDDDGNLSITGRKKDIIITAGGKNIAPAEMEGHIKSIFGIGHAVVVGDRQPYLAALVALEEETREQLCAQLGIDPAPMPELAEHDKVVAYVEQQIEVQCNTKVARYQTVKKFTILARELSIDDEELTPTMKVKRNVVADNFAAEIDGLFG